MSGVEHGVGGIDEPAGATSAGTATAPDATSMSATGTTPPAGEPAAPAPLASLTSLLGGTIEGGTSCAADGTCD